MIPSNAALTSDSARAKLSQEVLQTLIAENTDIIAIQETKLSAIRVLKETLGNFRGTLPRFTKTRGALPKNLPVKGYAGTMFLYKKELNPLSLSQKSVALLPWTWKVVSSLLEFDEFFVTQVYTPNAGDGLKRLEERQVWDVKYA